MAANQNTEYTRLKKESKNLMRLLKLKGGWGAPKDLPAALEASIGQGKLTRFDRRLENAIAHEALRIGWEFWALDAWVEFDDVEKWHQALVGAFMVRGVVLFSESSAYGASSKSNVKRCWHGRWICLLKPGLDKRSLRLSKLPGFSASPERPSWELLFRSRRSSSIFQPPAAWRR